MKKILKVSDAGETSGLQYARTSRRMGPGTWGDSKGSKLECFEKNDS